MRLASSICERCSYLHFLAQLHTDGNLDFFFFFRMCSPSVNSLDIIMLICVALRSLESLAYDDVLKKIVF